MSTDPALLPGLLDGGDVTWRCPKCPLAVATTVKLPTVPVCTHGGRGRPARMHGVRLTEVSS
jgi:hypothetical protein